ncbi:MAG: hypothetical protein RLZZ338_141 [Cyanobacteriota bacterium]|jgi:hypothetical protein
MFGLILFLLNCQKTRDREPLQTPFLPVGAPSPTSMPPNQSPQKPAPHHFTL